MKNEKIKKLFKSLSWVLHKLMSLSFIKYILFFYLFITLIGSFILYAPISQQKGVNIDYLDALFTSASSFSDTGLITKVTSETWTYFGQFIIALLILVGGIGWFALKVYFFNILLGRPISFRTVEILSAERGTTKIGETKKIIKVSVTILFSILFLSSIILTLFFYFANTPTSQYITDNPKSLTEVPYHNADTALRWGIFHSISALNNAGFDIMGNASLRPYYDVYSIQIIFMALFIMGGIGYPVIYDIFLYFRSKIKKEEFKWTLFTKVSMVAYFSIAIIGLFIVFMAEGFQKNTDGITTFWSNPKYGSKSNKIMAIIFNTFSTRNAGFSTIDLKEMSSFSLIIYSIMMFVGSAPSSTAGGIRTTTIAIIILSLWARIRGRNSVRVFNSRLPKKTIEKSYTVFVTALIIVIVTWMISISSYKEYGGQIERYNTATKKGFNNVHLLFEISSAFGTTGLSTGLTSRLSVASKLSLIIIMFIGQLGVSLSLLAWSNKNNKSMNFNYVKEDITIG